MKKLIPICALYIFIQVLWAGTNIVPRITSLQLRTDGVSAVMYDVINNENTTISNITIDLPQIDQVNFQVIANNCTFLNKSDRCQFRLLIKGMKAQSISVIPKVCGNDEHGTKHCFESLKDTSLSIDFVKPQIDAQVYIATNEQSLLPINISNNKLGQPISGFNYKNKDELFTPVRISISKDGSLLYVPNYEDKTIAEVDALTKTIKRTVKLSDINYFSALALSPDGEILYVTTVTSSNKTLRHFITIINVNRMEVIKRIPVATTLEPFSLYNFQITATGDKLYFTKWNLGDRGCTISYIDLKTENIIDAIYFPYNYKIKLLVSAENGQLYIIDRNIYKVSTSDYAYVGEPISVPMAVEVATIAPTNNKIFLISIDNMEAIIVDIDTNKIEKVIPLLAPWAQGKIVDINITPDGTKAYVTHALYKQLIVINTIKQKAELLNINSYQYSAGHFIG